MLEYENSMFNQPNTKIFTFYDDGFYLDEDDDI